MNRPIRLIAAPSNLGLMPPQLGKEPGAKGLAAALKANGLIERIGAQDVGIVTPALYREARDPTTGIRNAEAIRAFSLDLADQVGAVLDAKAFPLVLGGDCSILIGCVLALRRRESFMGHGLLFLDGHTDFQTPETSRTGGAAGMDLALVSGHGPDLLTNIDDLKPLVDENYVVVCANRDINDRATYYARAIFDTPISICTLDQLRENGIDMVVESVLELFYETKGFWIHLDADVIDSAIMSAVDSPQPDGLRYDELIALLRMLLHSGQAVGMDITIYDPDRDPDGRIGREFTDALVRAFTEGDHADDDTAD